MSKSRRNLLTGRLAEHLVCAELSRMGLIATTFSHNVPDFDILATDEYCHPVPIQVKASNSNWWRSSASKWMVIEKDETNKKQTIKGLKPLSTPNLIWVCVALKSKDQPNDRYFILKETDVQKILFESYTYDLEQVSGKRKKNWEAVDCWWEIEDMEKKNYENNWELILSEFKNKKEA
jgi:hypothetical protein